jgi:Oxysterol-binding protein
MRILKVAAFAVASYASSEGRPCKPFNPLLGETYEADFPERGIRFISEKALYSPPPPKKKIQNKTHTKKGKRGINKKNQLT